MSFVVVSPSPPPHLKPETSHDPGLALGCGIAFVFDLEQDGLQPVRLKFYWKAAMPFH